MQLRVECPVSVDVLGWHNQRAAHERFAETPKRQAAGDGLRTAAAQLRKSRERRERDRERRRGSKR